MAAYPGLELTRETLARDNCATHMTKILLIRPTTKLLGASRQREGEAEADGH